MRLLKRSPDTVAPRPAFELERLLARYGVPRESQCARGMLRYLATLEKWNARINLTATSSWETVGPLFEEGIWAAQFYPSGSKAHLDIGSGAGFPALPLRLLQPEMRLDLIESRVRRCAFLETVVSELSLDGTRVFNVRLDEFLLGEGGSREWDTVSWKAIKLNSKDLGLLLRRCREGTQFWVFHSGVMPLSEPGDAASLLHLLRQEPCPARKGWFLSIFGKR
jgi:16S rRNA (guanine(527)-N(7))-methyltransferase RsmG